MTKTLTTEQLLEVIERCKVNEPSPHLLVGIDLAREMARELLANREAQPVAWTTPEELSEADCGDVWMWLAPRKYPGEIALYTVPTVPAVPE